MSNSNDGCSAGLGYLGVIGLGLGIIFIIKCVSGIVIGIVWGLRISTLNFIISLRLLKNRPGKGDRHKLTDFCYDSYYYWRGDWITNIGHIIRENFHQNKASLSNYKDRLVRATAKTNLFTFFIHLVPVYISMSLRILMVLCGFIIFMPLISIPALLLGIAIVLSLNIIAAVLYLIERIIILVRGIFVLCPHCSQAIGLPQYMCPTCGRAHNSLIPSPRHGILYHTCLCGTRMPATRFVGRSGLTPKCPKCSGSLSSRSEDVKAVTLAFVGGRSSGKSTLQAALINQFAIWAQEARGCVLSKSFNQSGLTNLLNDWASSNRAINSTMRTTAYGIDVKGALTLTTRRLYIFDPAGEDFTRMQKLSEHRYYRYLKTAIFVIDPLSLYDVQSELQSKHPAMFTNNGASSDPVKDILGRWLITMNDNHRGVAERTHCAFVITKADIPELSKFSPIHPGCDEASCRNFLMRAGMSGLLAQAETFKSVHFFAVCSMRDKCKETGLPQLLDWVIENTDI